MSHFYGVLQGDRGDVTRRGTKESGLRTTAASWAGAVVVELYVDAAGRDCYSVGQIPWHGRGVSVPIATGVIGVKS